MLTLALVGRYHPPRPMRTLYILLLLSVSLSGYAQDSLRQERALQVLDEVHHAIVSWHPVGQLHTGQVALAEAYVLAEKELQSHVDAPGDSVAIQDFIAAAGKLQEATGCGHLQLTPQRGKQWIRQRKGRQLFGVIRVADGSFVTRGKVGLTGGDSLAVGTPLLQLDGRPVEQLVSYLAIFQGINDAGSNVGPRYRAARYLSGLYDARYGAKDSLLVTYLAEGSPEPKEGYAAMLPAKGDAKLPADHGKKKRSREERREDQLKKFSYELSEDGSAWVMTIRSFSDSAYPFRGFRRSVRDAFEEINASGVDKLVVDLRLNGGGDVTNARYLCSYLAKASFSIADEIYSTTPGANGKGLFNKMGMYVVAGVRKKHGVWRMDGKTKLTQPHKDAFSGEVIALIHELSFSATALTANVLQQTQSALLLGGPTGGGRARTYGGNIRELVIGDRSGVRFELNMPNWVFVPYRAGEGTVMPDEIVPITRQDIIDGRDVHLETALQRLNGK